MWHTSPTTACKPHHNPNPPCENLATTTQHSSPATSTHCTWWVGVVVGFTCCGGTCEPHWSGAVARFSQGGLALKSGLHAVLGWHWSSVMASLAHHDIGRAS